MHFAAQHVHCIVLYSATEYADFTIYMFVDSSCMIISLGTANGQCIELCCVLDPSLVEKWCDFLWGDSTIFHCG